ncbi:MAG TPA: tetratricopeptide repeat protein [Methylomirabilota bacterium]|nr:tetratricopeptide repeat protein [Methylomirabilota bacterium]
MRAAVTVLALALVAFALPPGPAAGASALPTMLLLPFDNATGDPAFAALERGVPDLIGAMLSRQPGRVRLLERERLDEVAREKSLTWQQYVSQTSLSRIGTLSQARYIARGSFTRTGNRLLVQALVYETETTRLVASAQGAGDASALVAVCEDLAGKIARALPTETAAALPADDDPERSLLMIQGLGYFYSGQFNKAVPAFMKILARHPDDGSARYWLARSFSEAGLRQHAVIELREFLRSSPDHVKAPEARRLLGKLEEGERSK